MATTSSNLVAGKALAGQGGNRHNGRGGLKAKVALGMAALGCAGALAFGGLRPERSAPAQPPVAAPVAAEVNTTSDLGTAYDPYVINGSQRRYTPAMSRAQIWTGTCRAGSSDCLPEEDFLASPLAPVAQPTGASVAEDYRWAFGAAPSAPATVTGETPCATGGTAPCGLFEERTGGGTAPSPLSGPQP